MEDDLYNDYSKTDEIKKIEKEIDDLEKEKTKTTIEIGIQLKNLKDLFGTNEKEFYQRTNYKCLMVECYFD